MICLDGRIEMPYNSILAEEIKYLFDDGKKIDHKRGYWKDAFDAYSCCVYKIVQTAESGGFCMSIFEDPQDEADFLGVNIKKDEKGAPMFTQEEDLQEFAIAGYNNEKGEKSFHNNIQHRQFLFSDEE